MSIISVGKTSNNNTTTENPLVKTESHPTIKHPDVAFSTTKLPILINSTEPAVLDKVANAMNYISNYFGGEDNLIVFCVLIIPSIEILILAAWYFIKKCFPSIRTPVRLVQCRQNLMAHFNNTSFVSNTSSPPNDTNTEFVNVSDSDVSFRSCLHDSNVWTIFMSNE